MENPEKIPEYVKQNIETAKQLLAEEAETQKKEALENGRTVWEKQDMITR